uniref:RNA-dependent RNA polymerase n=1 Tax=Schizophyllum commune (strain H4-8 / FGSC 9210) TaxID=578458 RepID=D8QDB2_SCHCM
MASAPLLLKKERRKIWRLDVDLDKAQETLNPEVRFDCRAFRLLGDPERLVSVRFIRKPKKEDIKGWIRRCQSGGKVLNVDGTNVKYSWLGFTESQLKDGTFLLLREDEHWTVDRFLDALGNVKSIPDELVATIPDFQATDGTLFTDGCGLIRDSCAAEVCSALEIPEDTTVFQIRRGGVKGLLVRYPDVVFDRICRDAGRRGPMKIALRPSMRKYPGGPTVLEIHSVARRPRSARLNRHFIILLLTLGVRLEAFESLLRANLEFIDLIMTSRQRALDALEAELDADGAGFDQELHDLLLAGFQLSEPHVRCLLERLQKRSLDVLRKKLNIRVKNSFYLFGVCDELGVLREGEVYINVAGDVKLGTVLVGRNPAYSTSVLRVLQAVNRPGLSHLRNCIVFASGGARSETSKMQGDVDGDNFWVTTEPSLIPPRMAEPPPFAQPVSTAPAPMSPEANTVHTVSEIDMHTISGVDMHTVSEIDMHEDALKTYMRLRHSFVLGQASKAWMENVVLTSELADAPVARELAGIVERAVDLVKSGGSASRLESNLKTTLGTMSIQRTPGWQDPLAFLVSIIPSSPRGQQTDFTIDPDLDLSGSVDREEWENLVEEARRIMPLFNNALASAIRTEQETAEDGDDEREAMKETDVVKERFLKSHFPRVNIMTLPKQWAKASAWYVTGYRAHKEAFSWLPARYLAHIKAHCSAATSATALD